MNTHYPQRIINDDTILIDGGNVTTFDTAKVRRQACKHFFNSDTIEKVGNGHIL